MVPTSQSTRRGRRTKHHNSPVWRAESSLGAGRANHPAEQLSRVPSECSEVRSAEQAPLDRDIMETLACSTVQVVGDELESTKAAGVDFWHLRTGVATHVPARTACSRRSAVVAVVDRFADRTESNARRARVLITSDLRAE